MKNTDKLLDFLSRNKKKISPLLILTHDYPDPDSIASAFALQYIARKHYGISSRIGYGGIISRLENKYMIEHLRIPVHEVKPADLQKYRHIALVDTQPEFGNNSFPGERRAAVVIDQHHPVSHSNADLAIVDTERSATCEILAKALLALQSDVPPRLATALVYGILSDTMNLYRIKKSSVFGVYLSLLPFCDLKMLVKLQNPPRAEEFFVIMARAIQRAVLFQSVICCHLGFVDDPIFVAHTADFLLTYQKAHWSFCTGRYHGRLFLSLRTSRSDVLAYGILRGMGTDKANVGGHGAIAGGSVYLGKHLEEWGWQKKEQELTGKLMRRLHLRGAKTTSPFFRN